MANEIMRAEGLASLTDEELGARTAAAAAELPANLERFAIEIANGVRAPEAARRAGLSDAGGSPYDRTRRPGMRELVLLLREAARRQAIVSASSQITRVQTLSEKAENVGDLGVALSAEKEISKLAGIYPSEGSGVPRAGAISLVLNLGRDPGAPDVGPELVTFGEEPRELKAHQHEHGVLEPAARAVVQVRSSTVEADDALAAMLK